MRLIFLFTSYGAAPVGTKVPWSSGIPATNKFAAGEGGFMSEGYFYLLKRMLESGIVDEVVVFIESNRGTGHCSFKTKKGEIHCYVVPEIAYVDDFLRPDDIIWARGGFRGWWWWLNSKKNKHWLLLYAADTGRERWFFWDVIFNDLNDGYTLDRHGRFWMPFKKPMHEEIFKPLKLEQKYDLCIGSSHVHDKKAQWKIIDILIEYKKLYSTTPKSVLAGAFRRGAQTSNILNKVAANTLQVDIVGMLPRVKMNEIYNQSKLFIYLGYGGQNDRGPLESLRCGTPIIIASRNRHAFFFNEDHKVVKVAGDSEDFKEVARGIHHLLHTTKDTPTREETAQFFEKHSGIETVILPTTKRLFEVLGNNKPDTKLLEKEYINGI